MSAITAKASRKMKKYAVLTREPRCFLGSFDFSWEQRKLASLCEKFTDGDWIESKDQSDFGVRLVQTGNVGVAEYLDKPNNKKWISEDTFDRLHCEEVLPGDILISRLPEPAGRACIVPLLGTKMITAVDCTIVRTAPDMSNKFLVQYLSSQAYFDDVNTCLAGGTRQRISRGNLANFNVPIPVKKSEQDAIGMFFGYLDNLITLHQRKCALLFSPFQAFISMMFTTSTFSWEQRKAIDIADYSKGNGYSKGDLTDAGTPIILYGRLYTKYQFAISEVDTFAVPRNGAVYSQGNEVIVPASGETAEDIARASAVEKSGVLLGGDLNILRPFDFINPLFLALAISNGEPQKELAKKAQGKSVVHIHNTDIQEVTIAYPSRTEQDRIVSVFRQLDNLITLHQRKCIFFTGRAGRLISTVNKKRITSSWEQRKLGDMMNVTSVKRIHQSDWTDSGVRFLRARDIVAAAKNEEPDDYLYISKEKYEEYSTLSGKVGVSDLLVTGVGTIGVPYLVRNLEPLYFKDGNIIWFQNSDKIDGKFLFYSFSAEQIQGFINESAGIGTVGTYTIESGKKTPISLPNQIEQAKVGEFFQQLDNLITLHQRKPFLMKWRTSDANRNQTNRLVL